MSQRLLVIGLDGASFQVLDALIADGCMPSVSELMAQGARAELETIFPPITAPAWSSFMTGKNPGKHGIFEFVRRASGREMAVNASFRRGRAIWEILSQAGKRVIVHNFPCTYPPAPINGIMIADFMTPRGRRDFTHPEALLSEVENRFGPYRLHLSQTYARGGAEGVLRELEDELDYKVKVTKYLMAGYDWDAFFQYFWGTDRIQHELWHIIDPTHPRHDPQEAKLHRRRVYDYFRRVDEAVGELVAMAGSDSLTWIVSDHGFGPVHKYCSLNVWLLEEGFLKLKRDALTRLKAAIFRAGLTPELAFKLSNKLPFGKLRPGRGASARPAVSKLLSSIFLSFRDVDWSRTLAFSKGNYGQIYVNLKGREPYGIVEPSEYDAVCRKIIERLESLRDPLSGTPWVGRVFRREQIYSGPQLADAPDIAFLPADMRHLPIGNADFISNAFMVDAFGISGSHRMHGVLIARGDGIRRGVKADGARIVDVAPTILYLLGQEVPDDMDGRVLSEIISKGRLTESPPRIRSADPQGEGSAAEMFSPEEDAEVIQRLKDLGYIG
jgi:predicted AlkP superfamily phosphohydrolase/phosphomutase